MPTRPTLVVLGAGATRGASFVGNDGNLHIPPLDADFFRRLSRSPEGRSQQARALIGYVQKNHSATLDVSMEAVFVELEGAAEFYREFNINRGRILREPERTINHFYKVLPPVLRRSITAPCEHHQLLAQCLESGDSVISFNYDCLMDEALKTHGGRRWDPDTGYGQGLLINHADWWKQWGGGPDASRPIRLLKLHGSLNWDWDGHVINLLREPYERESAANAIVPPLGRKPVAEEPFSYAWRAARKAVKEAERLVVIGYSLPVADHLVRALFRADIDNDRLKEVIVVDPEPSVADRFLRLLTKTPPRVETMGSFERFAAWLQPDPA
jgi:hypothetical protein